MLTNKKIKYYFIGLFFILVFFIPYILNGDNSFFKIHDYLEQDFVNIKLNAKYLFHPMVLNIPEVLSGTFRGSIQVHSLLHVFAYKFVQGVWFLILNLISIAIVGYTGMFLLINKLYQEKYEKSVLYYPIITLGCFVYGITPTLLHGLTVLILPLVIYLALSIKDDDDGKNKYILPTISLFVGLATSLVYNGYLYLLLLTIYMGYYLIKKDLNTFKKYFLCFSLMFLGYITTYFYSFIALTEVSHRMEWILYSKDFFSIFWKNLSNGYIELKSYPLIPFITTVLYGIYCWIKKQKFDRNILYGLILIFIISFTMSIYKSELIVDILNSSSIGIFKTIQLDRICAFLYPIWSFIFIVNLLHLGCNIKTKKFKILFTIIFISLFTIQFFKLIEPSINNPYKYNIDALIHRNKKINKAYTYREFFEEDLMNEVKNYINKPLDSYRVISVWLNPAVAQYSGFYCLDGYITNYRLEYKHRFKDIIINELEKSNKKTYDYFETWGSRVYIPVSEFTDKNRPIPFGPSNVPKFNTNKTIKNLDINYKKLSEFGKVYIFSMCKIENSSDIKLEKSFNSNLTNRTLYLYTIK